MIFNADYSQNSWRETDVSLDANGETAESTENR